jgi:hypothetical protein
MIPARESHRGTAVETALGDLERALCRDRCHVVVSASTGSAKALLLGALAERVAGILRVIPLPPPDPGDELCAPILRELGEACGEDAEASLVAVVRRLATQGSALALVAEDAWALPERVLRRLGRLCALARPGLRLVLVAEAGSDRDAIAGFVAPLGIGAVKVSLDGPPQRPASGDRPAPATPPRVGSYADAMRPIRVKRAPARRPARVALVGVAIGALGLAAANRIELPSWRASTPVRALRHAAPAARAKPAPLPIAEPIAPAAVELAPVALAAAAVELAAVPAAVTAADPVAIAPAPEQVAPAELSTPIDVAAAEPFAPAEAAAAEATAEPEEPSVPTVRVSLNAQPWAHIAVDGRDVGVTPMADVELTEGLHRFRARFPDGRVMERTLRVDSVRDHLSFP